MVIFLVGYMGCGKSSLGKRLAAELGYRFVDTDTYIEQRCGGMRVADIFTAYGEPGFRRMEREAVEELGRSLNTVVATGGGAPMEEGNIEAMNTAGLTIYLRMSPDRLVRRLEHGRDKRPLIRGMDDSQLLGFIEENLAARELRYLKAKVIIDCNGVSDRYVIDHIEQILKYRNEIDGR